MTKNYGSFSIYTKTGFIIGKNGMPKQHVVQRGECLSSIAEKYGFSPKTIWDNPVNEGLRSSRKDGNVLYAGDKLIIPDKRLGIMEGETETRHRYRRKGVPAKLRLILTNQNGPRAGIKYTLYVDEKRYHGSTDVNGRIEHAIPPQARKGKLLVGDKEEYKLQLGNLDPVAEISGIRMRLFNLGYLIKSSSDVNALSEAVKHFQKDNNLTVSGQADASTRRKLYQIHGS